MMSIPGTLVLIESTVEYREEQLIKSSPAQSHLSLHFTTGASNTNCTTVTSPFVVLEIGVTAIVLFLSDVMKAL